MVDIVPVMENYPQSKNNILGDSRGQSILSYHIVANRTTLVRHMHVPKPFIK